MCTFCTLLHHHPLLPPTDPTRTYFNGVTAGESVQLKGAGKVSRCKLRPDVVLGETVVDTEVLNPRRKTLIEPQVRPPLLQRSTQARGQGKSHMTRKQLRCSHQQSNKYNYLSYFI